MLQGGQALRRRKRRKMQQWRAAKRVLEEQGVDGKAARCTGHDPGCGQGAIETLLGLPLTSPASDLPSPNHPSLCPSPEPSPSFLKCARHGPTPGPLRLLLLHLEGCPARIHVVSPPPFTVQRTPSREPSSELPIRGDDQPTTSDAPSPTLSCSIFLLTSAAF